MNSIVFKPFLAIIFFAFASYQPITKQNKLNIQQPIQIEVLNCMSSIAYQFDGDSVIIKNKFYDEKRFSAAKVDSNDKKRFAIAFNKLFESDENEVLDNNCINDGFHLKVVLRLKEKQKKIFVGNYYDKRVDSLITVFDKFIDRSNQILKYNAFRYSKSKDHIQEMIKDQEVCKQPMSDKMKEHLLNSFCE